jgi:hypothetical protein
LASTRARLRRTGKTRAKSHLADISSRPNVSNVSESYPQHTNLDHIRGLAKPPVAQIEQPSEYNNQKKLQISEAESEPEDGARRTARNIPSDLAFSLTCAPTPGPSHPQPAWTREPQKAPRREGPANRDWVVAPNIAPKAPGLTAEGPPRSSGYLHPPREGLTALLKRLEARFSNAGSIPGISEPGVGARGGVGAGPGPGRTACGSPGAGKTAETEERC